MCSINFVTCCSYYAFIIESRQSIENIECHKVYWMKRIYWIKGILNKGYAIVCNKMYLKMNLIFPVENYSIALTVSFTYFYKKLSIWGLREQTYVESDVIKCFILLESATNEPHIRFNPYIEGFRRCRHVFGIVRLLCTVILPIFTYICLFKGLLEQT